MVFLIPAVFRVRVCSVRGLYLPCGVCLASAVYLSVIVWIAFGTVWWAIWDHRWGHVGLPGGSSWRRPTFNFLTNNGKYYYYLSAL